MLWSFVFTMLAVVLLARLAQQALAVAYGRYRAIFTDQADVRLAEVFLFLDARQLWALNVAFCAAVVLLVGLMSANVVLALMLGLGALGVPPLLARRTRQRRLAKFDAQLPDLLLALAGALRAGSGMQTALRQVVSGFAPPLSQELGLMLREQRMGRAFDEALSGLSMRMPTESTRLVVSALTIATHNGGNLAETLERIAFTLRSRLHLLGRIDALTAQGRMQAWVMAGLPLLLAVALHYLEPQAMAQLWESALGWTLIATVLVLEVAGVLLIRRIVNIEV
ncbi:MULTISPECIES: type II secretion system F family protein [unclassified Pusillimonas]|uniref:type II secretion system F family protein n=1 Tax=unclassified Pusillimonas TaxID=2640016 RepID=UPI000B9C84C4|nr:MULTISPECIES: type II secretion system F family protein [unclassified Pusillimonas]OXR49509.1 pilus assembly protein [Pusillimonas sp. T2]ROT44205.1 pilus assembly protein [Pusillimonas sp. NJUB218]